MSRSSRRRRATVIIIINILLLLLLCGMLYIYSSMVNSPRLKAVKAGVEGAEWLGAAYGLTGDVPLDQPTGVAYDGDNAIYVTEPAKMRISVFDKQLKNGRVFVEDKLDSKNKRVVSKFKVFNPQGIDVGPDGNIYVADNKKMSIIVFTPEGRKVRELAYMNPRDVKVTEDGVWVLGAGKLSLLASNGTIKREFGSYGRGPDQLSSPNAVDVAKNGLIIVSDMMNTRIIAFDKNLNKKWTFGEAQFGPSQPKAKFGAPAGLAVGSDGTIWIVDVLNHHLRAISDKGKDISLPVGQSGRLEDQFQYPTDITSLGDGTFAICDRGNGRVVKMRLTTVAKKAGSGVIEEGE